MHRLACSKAFDFWKNVDLFLFCWKLKSWNSKPKYSDLNFVLIKRRNTNIILCGNFLSQFLLSHLLVPGTQQERPQAKKHSQVNIFQLATKLLVRHSAAKKTIGPQKHLVALPGQWVWCFSNVWCPADASVLSPTSQITSKLNWPHRLTARFLPAAEKQNPLFKAEGHRQSWKCDTRAKCHVFASLWKYDSIKSSGDQGSTTNSKVEQIDALDYFFTWHGLFFFLYCKLYWMNWLNWIYCYNWQLEIKIC